MSDVEKAGKFVGDVLTGGAVSARDARQDARRRQRQMEQEQAQLQEEQTERRRNTLRRGLSRGVPSESLFDVLGGPQ